MRELLLSEILAGLPKMTREELVQIRERCSDELRDRSINCTSEFDGKRCERHIGHSGKHFKNVQSGGTVAKVSWQ